MKTKKTLLELIRLSTEQQGILNKQKNIEESAVKNENFIFKQKGFHSVEIDIDNGMCMYDYLYNDM